MGASRLDLPSHSWLMEEIWQTHQLSLVVEIPLFAGFFYISGGAGFLPSTVGVDFKECLEC